MRCPSCDHDNRTERRFCAECGAPLTVVCGSCGASNQLGDKFCGGCGGALTAEAPATVVATRGREPEPTSPAGERRQLTVLFCDLVGSTPLSQQLDAEEWRDVVEAYHRTAAAAVTRFGGHVAQYLGDGLLVYFGWPTAREDDPERAIRAGLAMLDAMGPLNAELTLPDGRRLAVRIGMHTGPVVVAAGGAIFGETANIAARVQSAADPETVVITAATQRLAAGMFVVEDRGPQALKGVREPVTLYRVVQPSGVRSRLDIAAGRLTRFVGREVELATLFERWERAHDGEGQNVLVVGEAGVGKSRLVYQLRERLATTPHTWLECAATPYTWGTPFHPVMALVSQGLDLAPADTPQEKLRKLERGLRELASTETVALLAAFLGLPPPTPLHMSPDLQRRKTMELLAQWNLALSTVQPLLVLVEDLHWCDASSLELLGRLVEQNATARMLLLTTARPELRAPWPARENMTTLQLARLTTRQARDMVAALGGAELPAATLGALVARAGGVPLYIEELTKAMVEPGSASSVEAIPATLADTLMARLDRLSTAKEVAQRAAVLGREFAYPLLAAVLGLEDAGLRHGLSRLVDAEILFVRGEPPEATYRFKHALVQEAAYESLLKRMRQQLHRRVVDVLVERFPERAAAEPEVVARHAEVAGSIDDAITYYGRAGEHAQVRSAHEESIGHLRHAITLLGTQPEGRERDVREVALQLVLAGSLVAGRGFAHPEAEAAYARARVLCDAVGDPDRLGLALVGLANFYSARGEVERGRALAAHVLAAAAQRGDRELALHAHIQVATTENYQGKFASSLAHCEAARTLYEPGGHYRAVSTLAGDPGVSTLIYTAWNLWFLGWPDRALARARAAVVLARKLGNPFSLEQALVFESAVRWVRRDLAALRERAAEAIALGEAQGFPQWLPIARTLHAAARVAEGEPVAVADVLAGLAGTETGNQAAAPASYALLGEVYLSAAKLTEARSAVEAGLGVSAHSGQPFFDADLHRLQAEIALATGGASVEAEALFHRALAIARAQAARSFELRAAASLARLWRAEARPAEARALLAPVYGWFTEGLDTRDLIEAKALLEELK